MSDAEIIATVKGVEEEDEESDNNGVEELDNAPVPPKINKIRRATEVLNRAAIYSQNGRGLTRLQKKAGQIREGCPLQLKTNNNGHIFCQQF